MPTNKHERRCQQIAHLCQAPASVPTSQVIPKNQAYTVKTRVRAPQSVPKR